VCGIDENCPQNFGQKTERKIPLGRPRYRSEDNLKLILVHGGLVWMQTGFCGRGGDFFFNTKSMVVCFFYVVSVMKFQVFWNVTPCQLVNS